jgi:YggT family protein
MGVAASLTLPTGDAVTSVDEFLYVFATVYTLVIFAYILTSWLRLPYSPTLNRIQRFLYDVCEPYIRFWRRILPFSAGPFDFSPMVAVLALIVLERIVFTILGRLH